MSRTTDSAGANQGFLLLAFGVSAVVSLVLSVWLGGSLDAADFGFFALVAAVSTFGRDSADLGTSAAAAREMASHPDRERELLEGLVMWRWMVGGVLALGVVVLALYEPEAGKRLLLLAAAGTLAAMGPTAFHAVFLARQAMRLPALLTVSNQLLLLAACLWCLSERFPGLTFAGLIVLREVVWIIGLGVLGYALIGYRLTPDPSRSRLAPVLRVVSSYALAVLCQKLYLHSDVLMVLLIRGEQELGAYAAAFRLLVPAFAVPGLAVAPLVPILTLAARDREALYWEQITQGLRLALGVGALAATLGMALAPDVIEVVYRGKYLEPPFDVVGSMRWLAFALWPVHLSAVLAVALLAAKKDRALLNIALLGLALNIAGNLSLVPRFGFEAAALTTALTNVVVCAGLWVTLFGRRLLRRPGGLPWLELSPSLVSGLVLAVADLDPPIRLGLGATLGIAGFLGLLFSTTGRSYARVFRAPPPEDQRG